MIIESGLITGLVGAIVVTLFPDATPGVIICAFSGAAIYVLSSENLPPLKQVIFAVISFTGGVYSASAASDIMTVIINSALKTIEISDKITINKPVGALIGSTIIVTILLKILSRYKNENDGQNRNG